MEPAGIVFDKIVKYQTYLEKCINNSKVPEKDVSADLYLFLDCYCSIMIVLSKLNGLAITLEHLQETGIGKTVNSYRKHAYEKVAICARTLVSKWKQLAEAAVLEITLNGSLPSEPQVQPALTLPIDEATSTQKSAKKTSAAPSQGKVTKSLDTFSKISTCDSQQPATKSVSDLKTSSLPFPLPDTSDSAKHDQAGDSPTNGRSEKTSGSSRHRDTSSKRHSSVQQFSHGHSESGKSLDVGSHSKSVIHSKIGLSSKVSDHHSDSSSHSSRALSEKHHSKSAKTGSGESSVSLSDHPIVRKTNEEKSSSKSVEEKKFVRPAMNGHASSVTHDSEIAVTHSENGKSKSRSKKEQISSRVSSSKHSSGSIKESDSEPSKEKRARFDSDNESDEDNDGMTFEQMLTYDISNYAGSKKKKVEKSGSSHGSPNLQKHEKSSSKHHKKRVQTCSSISSVPAHLGKSENVKQYLENMDKSSLAAIVPQPRGEDILEAPHSPDRFETKYDIKRQDNETSEMDWVGPTKRHSRTSVYSGKKHVYLTEVPTLYQACIKVLMDNVSALDYVGPVPFYILKPVLERCTPLQLYHLEDLNPHFIGETDELWEVHCRREFRGHEPDEFDSWRELYLQLHDERETKLKSLTASIARTHVEKLAPVRSTKLAYVNSLAKPPREVRIQQMKYGTAKSASKSSASNTSSKSSSRELPPAEPTISVKQQLAGSIQQVMPVGAELKPKASVKVLAPMMAKTLRQMKVMRR